MSKEPTRLVDGDSGALGEDIAALRRRLPSQERLDTLAARLAAAGATGAGAPPHPAPLEPASLAPARQLRGLDPGAKLVIVALLAGGALVAGAVWWRGPDTAVEVQVAPVATARIGASGATTVAVPVPVPVAAQAPAPGSAATQVAAPPRNDGPAMGTAVTSPGSSEPAPPLLVPSVSAPPRTPAPPAERAEPVAARAAPRATTRFSDAPNPSGPLAESTVVVSEVELLKQARSALAADPVQAFALTERCRAQYPNGGFSQEREFIAISALVRIGRTDEARSRVSLFRTHYPSSAYLPRLTRMLGDE